MTNNKRNISHIVLTLFILLSTLNPHTITFLSLPDHQKVSVGDQIRFNLGLSSEFLKQLSLRVDTKSKNVLNLNGSDLNGKDYNLIDGSPKAIAPGVANIQFRLFGLLPVKNVEVKVMPQIHLIPGGHSIGVLLHSEGVMIVGQSIVEDAKGHRSNPAAEAGLKVGDVILKMNGKNVTTDYQVAATVDDAGKNKKPIKVLFKRHQKRMETEVNPVLCKETGRYRIGLYIRDSAAGVGTLSFYNPANQRYGALGHVISDSDTNQPIDISDGKIIKSAVQGIRAGRRGRPGEKVGMFIYDKSFNGNIDTNSIFGIYGSLNKEIVNPLYRQPLPIALTDQIKEGPAEMLTVLDGEKIESFKVNVEKVNRQVSPDSKGLIIKVVDPRLLNRTGGIIQGMSGSPLIQNGKIIGAVTHVFINDPTKGYGCLIEWMVLESEKRQTQQKKAS